MKRFLLILLWISFFCFWFDLFHMLFHLSKAPALRGVSGVGGKLLVKAAVWMIPLNLLIFRRKWMRLLVFIFLMPIFSQSAQASFWGEGKSACQSAREMLQESGTARDAKENLFGGIRFTPPKDRFPQDADQVTWWGKFHPFEFWQSPEFTASWLNPQGQEVARQKFKGGHCALAKSGIHAQILPRGEFQPGIWKVQITCDNIPVNEQFFEIAGPRMPASQAVRQDIAPAREGAVTIWAKDKVNG